MQQIGRYQVIEELGRGAMGIVFRALDPAIGRTIAIKSIRLSDISDASEQQRLHDRLIREAQSAGILSHPNIVTIYDILEQDGVTHIFMEFVDGPSLEKMLSGRTLPSGDMLLELLRQVANGLDYAHKRGIVHRDIKPANLMLHVDNSTGEHLAKITDFGVAKFASQQMTQAGAMMGTPTYMAPEQIHSADVDGRTDQFSLAVVVYETLTGQKPYTADYLPTLLYRIAREDELRAEVINSTLTVEVGDVLHKALSKSPDQRFESCGAFVEALSEACAGSPGWRPFPHFVDAGGFANPTLTGAGPELPHSGLTPAATDWSTNGGSATLSHNARAIDETYHFPPVRKRSRDLEESFPLWKKLLMAVLICAMLGAVVTIYHNYLAPEDDSKQVAGTTAPTPTPAPPSKPADSPSAGAAGKPEVQRPAPSNEAGAISNSAESAQNQQQPAPNLPPPPAQPSKAPEGAVQHADQQVAQPASANRQPASKSATASEAQNPIAVSGDVRFASSPQKARIVVDGDEAKSCNTPCQIHLPAGRHTLTVALGGYYLAQRIIHVPDDSSLYVPLAQITGWVQLLSTPPGAQIFIDGQLRGQTPATVKLPAGQHQILLVQGSQRREQSVNVRADTVERLTFSL